jgi:thioesterase domain-containing protein
METADDYTDDAASARAKTGLREWEGIVATAWENALRYKSIDRDTDFRDLKMNSNRAMEIIADIWSATSKELPINVFFEAPTINKMASAIADGSAFHAPSLVLFRDGDRSCPVFLFPGGPGNLMELTDLAGRLDYAGALYGVAFSGLDGVGPYYDRFEDEAERTVQIIRRVQPVGPVRLIGYSIGGITALETARLLRDRGSDVFLALIDTSLNDHLWPYALWVGFLWRKNLTRGAKLLKMIANGQLRPQRAPIKSPIGPRRRGTQLTYRFRNPRSPDYPYHSPYWSPHHTPNYTRVGANACRMKGFYQPRLYDGKVLFIVSESGENLSVRPRSVWRRYLPHAEWLTLAGNHFSILMGRRAFALSGLVSSRLSQTIPETRGE